MPPNDGALERAIAARDASNGTDWVGRWLDAPDEPSAQHGTIPVKPYQPGGGTTPQTDWVGKWLDAGDAQPAEPAAPKPQRAPGDIVRLVEESGPGYGGTAIRGVAGVARGIQDVADTLGQAGLYAAEKGAGLAERVGVISPASHQGVIEWRKRLNQQIADEQAAFEKAAAGSRAATIGEFGGELAGTAPFLGVGGKLISSAASALPRGIVANLASGPVLRGAGAGGTISALTSSTSDQPLGEQIGKGAVVGGALGPVGTGIENALSSGVGKAAGDLARTAIDKYGIPLRADQLSSNKMVKFFGSFMQRIPFTGFGPHAARQVVAGNRAIAKEMGENTDAVTSDVIQTVKKRLGPIFENVAHRTGIMDADRAFIHDIAGTLDHAKTSVHKEQVSGMANRIWDMFDRGKLDAKSYLSLRERGSPLSDMAKEEGSLGNYGRKLEAALDGLLERNAPADAVEALKQAKYQWAIMRAVEPLAKKAPLGDIHLASLVHRATGGDLLDLGHIGQRFIAEPPSSGTVERALIAGLLGGGAGGLAAYDPEHIQRNMAEVLGGVLAARIGGAALTSEGLSNLLIRAGQRGPSAIGRVVGPTLTPRSGALVGRNILPNVVWETLLPEQFASKPPAALTSQPP